MGEAINYQHKGLADGRWLKLSFFEQMANIGSEVERAIKWRTINKEYSQAAFDRALELIDLTLADARNRSRLRELSRVREALVDYFQFDNVYGSTDKVWQNYFYGFNYAARINA